VTSTPGPGKAFGAFSGVGFSSVHSLTFTMTAKHDALTVTFQRCYALTINVVNRPPPEEAADQCNPSPCCRGRGTQGHADCAPGVRSRGCPEAAGHSTVSSQTGACMDCN
jgi:hypothetical protein